MKSRRGFTLLEMLIAAAIMSVLAMLSTAAYRRTVAETHWQDSKNKLQAVASAVQRYQWDYPNRTFIPPATGEKLEFIPASALADCPTAASYNNKALIQCDYLENRSWSTAEIHIVACGGVKSGYICGLAPTGMSHPLACMSGISPRLSDEYLLTNNHAFCIDASSEGKS